MNGHFLLLMLACSLGTSAYAQSLERTVAQAQNDLQGNKKAQPASRAIRLNPSNRFNVAPEDVYKWKMATASATSKVKTSTPATRKVASPSKAKIASAEEYPDSINLYGVLDPTYGIDVEGLALHHAYSFQAAPGLSLHQTMNDVELPEATTYVRKGNEWYCFSNSQIVVVSAETGEVVRKAPFEAALRRAGGTYDPSDNCFYIGTWSGLYKVDADDLTYGVVGDGGINGYLMSVAAGPDALYEISWPGKLFTVDKATGATTLVTDKVYARSYANQGQSSAIDYATNTLYISFMDGKWNAHVDKFDLNTNTPIQGFDFAAGGSTMMGLYIPATEPGAPAAPTGIAYSDGKLHFVAPSKTYSSGEGLSGDLTAYITVDKQEKTFTVTAGQPASLDLPLEAGFHEVFVQVGNEAGRSQERVTRPFIGQDVPSAVDSLAFNTDDGKNMSLTWAAPKTSVNGGPVDDANVNYRVVRMPDGVVVAEGLKETKFSEPIPETHLRYYYEVTAFNGDAEGETAQSNVVPAGSVWVPPYTEEFPTQEDFDFFTVIDANNDGNTWTHMHPNNDDTLAEAYLHGNGVTNAETGTVATYDDDYLITPSIRLEKGNDYRLKFNDGDHWMSIETMEILLGTSADTASVIKKVAPTFNLYGHASDYTFIFNVPEDGLYNLFFHANTVGNSVNVVLDNISVDVYSNFEGPDSVQQLAAKAGALGALENTVTFTTPTKTYQQGALDAITHVNVYRNGGTTPVHVFENPGLGEQLSWTDTGVEQGSVTYRVVPFNAKGQGREALVTNWVGLDIPVNPDGAKGVMDENNHAVVTWEKVGDVGIHGGYVNPDDVKYVLYRYNEYNYMDHWEAVTDSTTGLTLTDETFSPSWGAQQEYVDYVVRAINSAGSDYGATVGIVLGEAYARPYAESFPGGEPSLVPWTLYAASYNYAWTNETGSGLSVKPYDGDEGMLKFSYLSEESNKQVIAGPRISLKDAVSPELSFYMYHGFEAEPEDLVLDLYANYQDEGWNIVKQVPYNNGADGWARYSLPLRTDAKDVQFAFAATAVDASASIYIDALKVDESVEKDLTVQSFTATKRVEKGEAGTATVTVANYGTATASAYTVLLLKDGVQVDSKQAENLAQNEVRTFTFALPTSKADASKTLAYQAVTLWAADTNASNDSSSVATMYVHGSVLPKVESLSGESQQSSVALTWQAPSTNETPDAVTDDFDSYEDFIIDKIGDWTTYDADGKNTAYFSGPEIAHVYEPKAWQVWDPEAAGFSLAKFDVLTPHSGEQYLACWAADENGYETGPQDDWLISPEVLGGSDLSFYYRVPNSGSDAQIFEIMYSEGGKDAADFVRLDRDSVEGTTNWVRFEYTVPETAKYFAIRNVSKGSYTVAFLDDVTYTPLYGATTELTLNGYNVYRDDELIATVEPGVTAYNDVVADASNHEYHVTALWDAGESNFSNGYTYDFATGIAKPSAGGTFSVRGGKHQLAVDGVRGQVNVHDLAGRTVAKVGVDGKTVISLPAGVYMVSAAGCTVKVVVR